MEILRVFYENNGNGSLSEFPESILKTSQAHQHPRLDLQNRFAERRNGQNLNRKDRTQRSDSVWVKSEANRVSFN